MQLVAHHSSNVLFISPAKIDSPKLKGVVNMVTEQDTAGRSYDDSYRAKYFVNNYERGRKKVPQCRCTHRNFTHMQTKMTIKKKITMNKFSV